MSEETKPIEEGAGFYNFEELLGNPLVEEKERDLEFVNEEEEETPPAPVEEEQEEDAPPVKPEEEEEEPSVQTSTGEKDYSSLAKKYIELGTWKDAEIEINGETVVLSELENLDEETFLEIVQAQDAQRNSELNEKFINKEDLDEISLKIIEISKNGGDIKDVLKAKETYIDNLNTYDLDNEQHQELLVRQKYKLQNPNFTEKQIDTLIKVHQEDLDLDVVAKDFADNLKASYHQMLDKKKKEAEDFKIAQQENLKNLRKSLRDEFTSLGLEDKAFKVLVDAATKETEGGFLIDKQFAELKQDPKELAEFLLWKNNREDYKKLVSQKQTAKEKKETLIKLNLLKGKTTPGKRVASEETNKTDELARNLKFIS